MDLTQGLSSQHNVQGLRDRLEQSYQPYCGRPSQNTKLITFLYFIFKSIVNNRVISQIFADIYLRNLVSQSLALPSQDYVKIWVGVAHI